VLAGLPFALLGGRLVRSLLFGIGAIDPVSIGGAAVALVSVAGIASMIPALRATRISAVQALRAD